MADFREMYYTLFRAQVKAKAIFEEAQKKTEAMFISSEEPVCLPNDEETAPGKD